MRVSELNGAALDWAVAKCEFEGSEDWDGTLEGVDCVSDIHGSIFSPSTDWAQGGLIIERELISLSRLFIEESWEAWTPTPNIPEIDHVYGYGPTPLIAAMRCYVASKMGDEIELPEGF